MLRDATFAVAAASPRLTDRFAVAGPDRPQRTRGAPARRVGASIRTDRSAGRRAATGGDKGTLGGAGGVERGMDPAPADIGIAAPNRMAAPRSSSRPQAPAMRASPSTAAGPTRHRPRRTAPGGLAGALTSGRSH